MLYCPKQFVLNMLGISLLSVIASAVLQKVLGLHGLTWFLLFLAPAFASALEGAEVAQKRGRLPHSSDMWRAAYEMAAIYSKVFFVVIIALVVSVDGPVPNVVSVPGIVTALALATSFLGAMTLGLRFGYWIGAHHALKDLKA